MKCCSQKEDCSVNKDFDKAPDPCLWRRVPLTGDRCNYRNEHVISCKFIISSLIWSIRGGSSRSCLCAAESIPGNQKPQMMRSRSVKRPGGGKARDKRPLPFSRMSPVHVSSRQPAVCRFVGSSCAWLLSPWGFWRPGCGCGQCSVGEKRSGEGKKKPWSGAKNT